MARPHWLLSAAFLLAAARLGADPIPVKVAVVVTFEVGQDTGDKPGEFQFWAEREKWGQPVIIPGVDHPVLTDAHGTIGVVSGTTARASNQIMALVLSGKFDFSKTYWVVNGIAGVNPAVASVGSAAWAHYVIDGDVAYEIDSREADPSWPYAIIPIGSTVPNERPTREGWEPDTMAYELNGPLVDWAYALTKDTRIPDSDAMTELRALYDGFPNAQKPPFVLCGETFGSCRYWHGKALTQWASDWTRLWTGGKGQFAMSDMEDQGIAAALSRLSRMGRVDFQRVLFLRTASNYCMQAPKEEVNKSLHSEYAGYLPSLEAAYRVGSRVTHELTAQWDTYREKTPAAR
ncbi:MAG: purine nucleoside permease [Opitutaceae bacterium]|jgi:purine nucleoside permease